MQIKPTKVPRGNGNEELKTFKYSQYVPRNLHCPQGSVPMRRATKEDLIMAKNIKSLGLNYPITKTHRRSSNKIDIKGHHVSTTFS